MRSSIILFLVAGLLYSDIYDNGFGINTSMGILSGGLGLNVEYQIAYKPKNRITPTVGAGINSLWLPSYSIGIINEFGYSNRFFTAVNFGSWLVKRSTVNGVVKEEFATIGPSIICGYKRIFGNGQMLNVGGGISVPLNNSDLPVLPAFNVGYGYKFGRKGENVSNDKLVPKLSLPSKYTFLKDLSEVSYIVTDPKHLIAKVNNIDTANQMYGAIRAKISERIQRYSLINFNELQVAYNRQVAVAFNNSAYKTDGILDSLPYALWERCINDSIRYFAAFYLYKTSDGAEVERNEIEFLTIPVPNVFGGIDFFNVPVYITLENIQIGFAIYDVKQNKLLIAGTSNDDDYESPVELIEDLFQEMGLR
jgi:hypothetical protein